MPNIITHTLFAEEVQKLLDNENLKNRRQLFAVGSNGPDFLFFHRVTPVSFWKKTPLRKMGARLHSGHVNEFYANLLHVIRKQKNEALKEDMIAYGAGHLCHWALDSTAHPYIFYRTGRCIARSADRHHRFESLIDAAMLKIRHNETIKTYNPAMEVCNLTESEMKAIVNAYYPVLKQIFDEDVRPYMIRESLQNWKTMQQIFHDPNGTKIAALQKAEKIFGLDNKLSGFGVPPVLEDNYDLLNLLHTPWRNPITGEVFTESFLDLYEEALHKAVRAIELFLAAIEDPSREDEFLEFLGNRNYDTGMDTDGGMQYFDIVDLSV